MKLLNTHNQKKLKPKSAIGRGGTIIIECSEKIYIFLLESVRLLPEVNIQAQQIVRGSNPFEFLLFKKTSTREFMNE